MKLLIIDDHALIRSGLRQLYAGKDVTVLEAENGGAALALQKAERPQFIVLDLNLPGVSGLELLRQLLQTDPSARILVTGCYAQRAPQELASMPGVSWVVGNSHKTEIANLVAISNASEPYHGNIQSGSRRSL